MYVSIETQNKMYMFRMEDGGFNPEIAYRAETLAARRTTLGARQAAGTVHVHPNGHFVYGAKQRLWLAKERRAPSRRQDPSGSIGV
jgi:6-phosphogluconolactonase